MPGTEQDRQVKMEEISFCERERAKLNSPKINHVTMLFSIRCGRRAFHMGRSQSGSAGGLYRSENAGMSSEKYVRIILAESLRF